MLEKILPFVMTQRYQSVNDGQTTVKYCVFNQGDENHVKNIESIKAPYESEKFFNVFDDARSSLSFISDARSCSSWVREFPTTPVEKWYDQIEHEKAFFVKASGYEDSLQLDQARTLAKQDHIRFQLYNDSNFCADFSKTYGILNVSKSEFYQKFVINSQSLEEIFSEIRPDLLLPQEEKFKPDVLDLETFNEASSFIDGALSTISKVANIAFEKQEDCNGVELSITPQSGGAGEEIYFDDHNKIILTNLDLITPNLKYGFTIPTFWNEIWHGIAHGFIDHSCENGFFSCDVDESRSLGAQKLSVLEDRLGTGFDYVIQSLLPYDIGAIEYMYGAANNLGATYILADEDNFKENFKVGMVNNSLVSLFPGSGATIDARGLEYYHIDLNQEQLSKTIHHDHHLSFYLSYSTSVSDVILDTSGDVVLSDEPANVIVSSGCSNVIINGQVGDNSCPSAIEVRISGFNPDVHHVMMG